MREHEYALLLALRRRLPHRIDTTSLPSAEVIRELVKAGYLEAIDASSMGGMAYLDPKITIAGRDYLDQQLTKSSDRETKMRGVRNDGSKSELRYPVTQLWTDIESAYGTSKKTFGKKIFFVNDRFKRRIIFRDTEHAFSLAESGFNKPAVILAGGVVEELLRYYLEFRNFAAESDTLDGYIKACEKYNLLKGAIYRLADSVRQFRNIVHLQKESSRKHTISKATAKAAVASIFMIANDFER
jgi:hypothetical protein